MNNRKEYKQLHRSYPSVPGFKINKFVSLKMELIGRGFSEDEPLTTFRRLGLDDQLVNMERELAREGRQ